MAKTEHGTVGPTTVAKYKQTVDVKTLSTFELEKLLTPKQRLFCSNYIKYLDGPTAARESGYGEKTAAKSARDLLRNNKFAIELIQRKQDEIQNATIADAQEILQYLTDVMRGEIKDQFGLDASLAERTKAAMELARRQIDLPAKMQEAENTAKIEISLKRNTKSEDNSDNVIDA